MIAVPAGAGAVAPGGAAPAAGTVLAADIGRTTCRVARYEGGVRVAAVQGPCGSSLSDRDGVARVRAAVASTLARLPSAVPVSSAVLGVTGAAQCPAAARALAGAVADDVGAPVRVVGDVTAAHAGAFAGGPGVLTVAGTGTVALGVGPGGRVALVDGWGPLLGDAGSALDVGRAGLAAALRARDGRAGGSRALAAAAAARFGDLSGLPGRVQGDPWPFRVLASFATDVAAVARAGDAVALAIFTRAVGHLVETTLAAALQVRAPGVELAVAFAGGLFTIDDLVAAPVRAAVAGIDLLQVRVAQGDALDGAHALAAVAGADDPAQADTAAASGTTGAQEPAPAVTAAPGVAPAPASVPAAPGAGTALAPHELQWAHPTTGPARASAPGRAAGA